MTRRSSDREAIEAEIDRIRSLGLDELRTLWRTTLRSSPPPAFTKDLMARFICWHIQEQALGGLDANTAKLLDGLARGDKPGAEPAPQARHRAGARIPGRATHRHGRAGRIRLARRDLREPLDHRARHHRHGLERPTLLWAACWRQSS